MSRELSRLTKFWYEKLRSTGFQDIEQTDGNLKSWECHVWAKRSQSTLDAKQQYFSRARELLEAYRFDNPTHKRIWELHCDGLSSRQIASQIGHMEPTYKHAHIRNTIIPLIAAEIVT
jgi:hypothetical protein